MCVFGYYSTGMQTGRHPNGLQVLPNDGIVLIAVQQVPPVPAAYHPPEVLCWHGDVVVNVAGHFLCVGTHWGSHVMPVRRHNSSPKLSSTKTAASSQVKQRKWIAQHFCSRR